MYTTPKIPALNLKLNYDNIVRLAFTHQQNRVKSIRAIARQLGMNPGTVYRILKRLGLVIP